jgi:adenylate kinase
MTLSEHNRRFHLVLLGSPGAGKSTIAERLVQHLPLTHIATGQRLRAEAERDTPMGHKIKPLLDQGHLVPTSLINQLVREWLQEVPPDQGFLLDGYPRSLEQAQALDDMLAELRRPLDRVINLELGLSAAIERLSGRRICAGSADSFTLHISDDAAVQRCREQGGHLVQRDDDKPEVIEERMRIYTEQTQPLLDHYARSGLLRTVDAQPAPADITAAILALLRDERRQV